MLAACTSLTRASQNLPDPPNFFPDPRDPPYFPTRDAKKVAMWHVDAEGWGLPAADGTSVYFLLRTHEVAAVAAASGRVRWRTATGEAPIGSFFASPFGRRVAVAGPVVAAGDYNLVAFDRETGALRWRFAGTDGGYAPGAFLGDTSDDVIFTGAAGGRLYALDSRTGSVRWAVRVVDHPIDKTVFAPVFRGEVVAAGYSVFTNPGIGGLVAVEAATGHVRWNVRYPEPDEGQNMTASGGPVIADDVVISTSGDGVIRAYDLRTGTPRWSIPRLSAIDARGFKEDVRYLALAGTTLLAGSQLTGEIVAYDIGTRRERWRYPGKHGSSLELTVDRGAVYVPYFGGRLVALSLDTGRERWRMGDNAAGFRWPPLAIGTRLYVAGTRAGLFALPYWTQGEATSP